MALWVVALLLLAGVASTADSQYRFTRTSYSVAVPEHSFPDTLVTPDYKMGMYGGGTNVTYRVVAGDPSQHFRVEERLVGDFWFLVVRVRYLNLNRERKDKYTLTVNATVTAGKAAHYDSAEVVVHIIDINDLSPLFYSTEYYATVPEDLPVHSSVERVYAEDADLGRNGEVYYSLLEPSEHFAVHPVTGVLTLMRPLRYVERSVYDLRVVARDRGVASKHDSPEATVRVTVTQVNLHGPEVYVYHLPELSEHSYVDVYAIARVIDRDDGVNGEIESLEIVDGDDDGHFRVARVGTPTPGVKGEEFNIEVIKLADKSNNLGGYNLTLRAIDKGKPPRKTYISVPFKVKETERNKAIFEREIYEVDVSENTPINSSIIRLKIDERNSLDFNQVFLEIVGGNEAGEFRINPRTGVLYTAIHLDADVKTFYTLTVSAIDHGTVRARKQSSAKVKVQVIDMNDNDPLFESSVMNVWINENEPAGASTAKVTAKDKDSGENAYISYSIANLNPVPFEIDHFTGLVRTTKVLDYESMRREYNLYIRASDWGTPYRRQSEMKLRVRLKDINDNKPLFEKTDCVGHLPRQVPMDTEIVTLSAIDLDAGNIITYRIASGNEDGCFSLDVTSGMLSVACDLTEVASTDRHINVTAYDGTHFADFARVHIKLINSERPRDFLVNGESASFNCKDLGVAKKLTEVLALAEKNNGPKSRQEDEVTLPNRYGANVHPPQLISMPNEVEINESVPLGYMVIKVRAVDKDLGYNGKLVFGITSGDLDSTFSIDQDTGELRVTGYLDREYRDRYYLNITVFDLGQPRLSCSKIISVVVLDVNDNAPVFDKNVVSFRIREDTLSGFEIFQFRASDRDLGENSHIRYQLETDTENFVIDSRSGILSIAEPLDRETIALHELRIKASDRASDPRDPDALHSHALARVIVDDVNDEVPTFPSQTCLVKIREDLPVGTVVVTVDAWDPDLDQGGTVRYSILHPIGDLPFSVDPETGTVRTTSRLDYEDRQVYGLVIKAEDLGVPSLWSEMNLTIEITDVNENTYPPMFEDFAFSARVRENLPAETLVTSLTASDADAAGEDSRISYVITGGSGLALFTIDEKGQIWTNAVLDREAADHYWLTVRAQDHGVAPLHCHAEVYVEVEDDNDNLPMAEEASYEVRVRENSPRHTVVLRVEAKDADTGSSAGVSYSITAGNAAGHFAVDDTGVIYTTSEDIDREQQSEYVLEVTLQDDGKPPLSSSVQVVVTVDDENDNSPQFDQTFYHIMIPEMNQKDSTFIIQNEVDASDTDLEFEALFVGEAWRSMDASNLTGYPVFRLVAKDDDAGVNGRVEYAVKSRHGRFIIHPATGVVYAQKPVPANHDYDLLVRATDYGSPRRSTTVRVSVHVMGAQGGDSSTLSPPPPIHTQVTELDPVGFLVAVVQPPVLDTALVWFTIVGGDPKGDFVIGSDSGSIHLARQLDFEMQNLYNLSISLSDSHRTVYTQVTVEVIDSNEFRPQFPQSHYTLTVGEGVVPGAVLGRVEAVDGDSSSQLVYSIHYARSPASLDLFHIHHLSGIITVALPLDRESMSEHVLTVCASDGTARGFARVTISVSDTNDHAPLWTSGGVVQADVLESAFPGTRVVTVTATDRDHGDNARLTYSIVSGNIGNFFSIDPVAGDILVARDLDVEATAEFNLMVRVVDGGDPPLASTLPVFIMIRQSDLARPRFQDGTNVVEVLENAPVGQLVWHALVRSAISVTYLIVHGNLEDRFTINPTTGVVTVKHPLDYETTAEYNLTISATNLAGVESQVTLLVDVVDCNDHAPELSATQYRGKIYEGLPAGSPVVSHLGGPLVLRAYDKDSTLLQYEILDLGPRRLFYIDSSTGAVRTLQRLDYETIREVTFRVAVQDRGRPPLSSRDVATVAIEVEDINDCPPRFTSMEYNTTLLLPTYSNVSIIQVAATDLDSTNNTKLEYSIVTGNYDNIYRISSDSGVISLSNKTRGRHKSPHQLKVAVSDGVHTTFAYVNIQWRWGSESSLRFTQQVYEGAVVENSTKVVTVAVATVVGAELNEHILFSILNPSPMFNIGVTSGAVRTTGIRFDREVEDQYQLIVQARSEVKSVEVRVAQALVTVTVLDINDNCPVFLGVPYYATAPVDATKGDVITKVHAIDLDAGENGEVRYELMRGHGELFRVSRKTGEVVLKQPLESQVREYQLSIAAYDGGMTPCSTEVWVHLTIVDRSLPLFEKQFYTVSIMEDVVPHSVLPVTVHAHIPSGMKLYYTIVAGNEYEIFSIDFNSGVLRVVDQLDYEDAQQHSLTVRATDLHSGIPAETLVKVKVVDVNDCFPEFPVNVYHASVSEAAAPGTFVVQVTATDKDTGAGGVVRYSLRKSTNTSGAMAELFTVEPEDGSVYLRRSLDREVSREHLLELVATDTGVPNLSTSVLVRITVEDSNDNPPQFARSIFVAQLSTQAVRGQFVGRVSAFDPDMDKLQYNLVTKNLHHTFVIEPDTGILRVMKVHKFMSGTPLELNVSVSDGVHTSYCMMVVELLLADHQPPVFQSQHYEVTLPENMAEPSFLLLVEAEDRHLEGEEEEEGQTELTYSLPSEKYADFISIDPYTGMLRSRRALDREVQALYDILVVAMDDSGHAAFTTVRLSVSDVNDNAPIFTLKRYHACVPSNLTINSAFLKVRATDADRGPAAQITYTLHSPSHSEVHQLVSVHPVSGTLYLQQSALTMEGRLYDFFIRAKDRGVPPLHADIPVSVYIMESSDEPPEFQRTDESFFISEDANIGQNITQLVLSSSSPVDFQVLDLDSPFSVTPDTGVMYLSLPLDRELSASHMVGVVAQSRNNPQLRTLTAVHVVVLDANDNAPVFHARQYRASLAEDVAIGTSVMQVEAEDADEGRNGEVYYVLDGGEGLFAVDTFTGWVTTAGALDRERSPSHNLTVTAMDNGSPSLNSSVCLLVDLVDCNDNPPVFSKAEYLVSVSEDQEEGSEVIRLEVSDLDTDSHLRLHIVEGDPDLQFAMDDALPGVIYLRRKLDRELRDSYILSVVATDSKFVSSARVLITVLDINDERSVCVQSRYFISITENVAPGTFVLTVAVEDRDIEPNVTFHLMGDSADHFYIQKEKGELKTSKQLDRETVPQYLLQVLVQDANEPDWACVSYLHISLKDVNDNAPMFQQAGHQVAVSEDSISGTFITKMTAQDPDRGVNRRIRYYLVNSGESHFEVDKDTAIVRLAKPLDRELQSLFTLIVKAVDSGMPQLWTLTTLQVVVLDVNDNPPEFVARVHEVAVPENASVASEVTKVEAVSKDTGVNAQVVYTIVEGNQHGRFNLHPVSGVISVAQALDYEHTKSYLLAVVATDQGVPPLSSQTTVNITVLDTNDNSPTFSQNTYATQVLEDVEVGEIILKVAASDSDSGANAHVSYSLDSGDPHHHFTLDTNSGELSVAKSLDRETTPSYMLTVRATDAGSPPLSSSVVVSVVVVDVNDNAPLLTNNNYTFFVQEDKMAGWPVGQLVASDSDTFPNGPPFSYSILSGNPDLEFRVHSDGTLYTAARLSTRVRAVYYLQVRVTDSGFPPLHTDTWVTVKVIEESRFAPELSPLEVFIIAYQERWPGGEIGHLAASDQDPYDSLVFGLEASGDLVKVFDVEPRRGVLTAGPRLDAGRYRLNVSASDGKFTVYTTVTVHIVPLWDDMLQNSVSIRLRSMTAHHFILRQWKSLVQLLEAALMREVTLTSLQAVPHGDLDILLTVAGGIELATLSDALQSAGLSGANWTCDCLNGALCKQKVQVQRDLVFTVATDYISFVCPGHSHQLYCACNLGFAGEHCEQILAGTPPHGCGPPAYMCGPLACPPAQSCPPTITSSISWEEVVAAIVAIFIISCLILVFILYRRCHRVSPGNRIDKSGLNHVIKRTSKLSNLQVTQSSRPTSYTCSSNNELFSAVALNNVEDNVPPDYRRNLMSPHHKINNDLKQTADIPMNQLMPVEEDTRTGGYLWDCSDCLLNGDVTQNEVPDSSSYHSNHSNHSKDSYQNGDPARELATLDTKLGCREDQVIPYGFPSTLDSCS